MRVISEPEFAERIATVLKHGGYPYEHYAAAAWVTGPGRSGAMAAVYASHILGIPYVPCGTTPRAHGRPLIIDVDHGTGQPMRRLMKRYRPYDPIACVLFAETKVRLWFEPVPAIQVFSREPITA